MSLWRQAVGGAEALRELQTAGDACKGELQARFRLMHQRLQITPSDAGFRDLLTHPDQSLLMAFRGRVSDVP